MRKSFVIILMLVFLLNIAGLVFAAERPFADVSAGHWAYGAIQQLAQAGIIEGYGDGTFRGTNTITRYEMAIITANAMSNLSKANKKQRELIEKLAAEFTGELKALGIRMTNLENKVNIGDPEQTISWRDMTDLENKVNTMVDARVSGEVREQYEWDKNQGNAIYTRFRLKLFAPLTDSLAFIGRIESENTAGTGPADNGANGSQVVNVNQAFIAGKALGLDTFMLGRIPLHLGEGLLSDSEMTGTTRAGAEGLVLGFGNQLKVAYAVGKAGLSDEYVATPGGTLPLTLNLQAGNLAYAVDKNLTLSASYLEDKRNTIYKSGAVGLRYTGIQNIALSSEYGKNDSDVAKAKNDNSSAKAWYARVKYLGADSAKDHSYGLWVGYRKADPGFDLYTFGSAGGVNVTRFQKDPFNAAGITSMSNVKGLDYGFAVTVFKNAILSLQYNDLKSKTSINAESCLVDLNYFF